MDICFFVYIIYYKAIRTKSNMYTVYLYTLILYMYIHSHIFHTLHWYIVILCINSNAHIYLLDIILSYSLQWQSGSNAHHWMSGCPLVPHKAPRGEGQMCWNPTKTGIYFFLGIKKEGQKKIKIHKIRKTYRKASLFFSTWIEVLQGWKYLILLPHLPPFRAALWLGDINGSVANLILAL